MPTVVLRVTDWDKHGRRIDQAAAEDSEAWSRYLGSPPGWLPFERIALTGDQAQQAGLLDGGGDAEADGLPVPVMDAILRDAIESHQDAQIRQQTANRAAEIRARLPELIRQQLNGGSSDERLV